MLSPFPVFLNVFFWSGFSSDESSWLMACAKSQAVSYHQEGANAWVDYLSLNQGQRFYLLGYLADNPEQQEGLAQESFSTRKKYLE